ncbi:protein crumbs-like isoform X2 [Adelges cooleyi]|uniref:protein crumbs-like isoform X2 n=1 Tax=Adelges cooleyi TaxID=133065 RepID=UPI0021802FAF|nr:protein crumbs-like isoform X2 [Adelges cooleyi]
MDATPYVLPLLLITIIMPVFEGCDQTRQGCRIQEGTCLCGVGCYSEYRYSNYEECHKALKGRRYDFCAQGPCYHNGVCVQTSQEPGYKCRCSGTGYYGARCEQKCFDQSHTKEVPFECIVI